MGTQDILAQYKLFVKYYNIADESQNLKDYQTAEKLRKKLVPQIDSLVDNDTAVELASLYGVFAEFLSCYFYCLDDNRQDSWSIRDGMRKMAEKTVELNPNSIEGHFFLVIFHYYNLSSAHAGNFDAYHQGQHPVESVGGTLAKLFAKGITLGATATTAKISKSKFTNSVRQLIEVYKNHLNASSLPATYYLRITSKMLGIAELCENARNPIGKDMYLTIKNFDVEKIDYSELDDKSSDEAREQAIEFVILANSNL